MSLDAKSAARPVSTAAPASLARVRRGSLAVLVLVVAEYLIGMYVNLFVTIPRADHGHSVGSAIANGPAILAAHAVIGLLLGLAALAVLVQAIVARHPGAIAASAAGLFALAFASAAGASFTSSGHLADSMVMSVLTGVGLLCYAANLYLLPRPGRRG
jgi:hypothetical protein